jgi:hypothetical protein
MSEKKKDLYDSLELDTTGAHDGKVLIGDVWAYNYYGDIDKTGVLCALSRKEVAWIERGEFRTVFPKDLIRLISRAGVEIEYDEPLDKFRIPTEKDIRDRVPALFSNDVDFPNNKTYGAILIGKSNNSTTGVGYVAGKDCKDIEVFKYCRIQIDYDE